MSDNDLVKDRGQLYDEVKELRARVAELEAERDEYKEAFKHARKETARRDECLFNVVAERDSLKCCGNCYYAGGAFIKMWCDCNSAHDYEGQVSGAHRCPHWTRKESK